MGLFRKLHERMQASVEFARQEAYTKALEAGASEEDARAAGDRAAKRRRRRQAAIIGANSSGGA